MMLHRAPVLTLAAAVAAGLPSPSSARGHGPAELRITVANDSIYALAVDSAAYREYPFVYLLDEGIVRYETDGRGTRTYHQVVQILKPAGVARWAEQRVAYQPDREKVIVNWMRVVKPSGEVISDKPTQAQTSDVPAAVANPVYTETKVIRYSLADVAPGTLVDLSWTIETTHPPMPGDGLNSWNISLPTPGMRSHFAVDVPVSITPHIVEQHLDFKRTEKVANGRRIYSWAAQNVMPPKGEMFAPDSSLPAMSVRVGLPITWDGIGKWYNSLSRDRYVLSAADAAVVDSIVRSAKSRADTLDDLHRWIAQDLRYVSVALGIGGYQPREPDATIATGYGDCKDKATLFIAATRHLGITAYPVLLNSSGGTDRALPAAEAFDHVIAAVPSSTRQGLTYIDLTTYAFTHGDIPPSYQGGFGLVVHPDGATQEITFPRDSAADTDQSFVGELAADGSVSGTFSIVVHGGQPALFRILKQSSDSAQLAILKRIAPKPFPGMTVDTVIVLEQSDSVPSPTIRFVEHGGSGAKSAGQLSILSIPAMFRGPGAAVNNTIQELQRDPRKLPIDASRVHGRGTGRAELHLTLPAGWTAQLPPAVTADGEFGNYHAEYTQVGRELRIVRTATGKTGVYPPSSIGALVDWFKAMGKDDAEFIAISRQ
ncbi:MAG: DUF3857 domain-containing transglutaminase family protein [Gemmatimonadales bacterium]